jgi:hypothetical protein
MRNGEKIASVLASLAIAACASAEAKVARQSMDFAWGCWIAHEKSSDRVTGFLRLLTNSPNRNVYAGYLHSVRGSEMHVVLHLSIAGDGSRVVMVRGGETFEFMSDRTAAMVTTDDRHKAEFVSLTRGKPGGVSLSGGEGKLSLVVQMGDVVEAFHGERGGCD